MSSSVCYEFPSLSSLVINHSSFPLPSWSKFCYGEECLIHNVWMGENSFLWSPVGVSGSAFIDSIQVSHHIYTSLSSSHYCPALIRIWSSKVLLDITHSIVLIPNPDGSSLLSICFQHHWDPNLMAILSISFCHYLYMALTLLSEDQFCLRNGDSRYFS